MQGGSFSSPLLWRAGCALLLCAVVRQTKRKQLPSKSASLRVQLCASFAPPMLSSQTLIAPSQLLTEAVKIDEAWPFEETNEINFVFGVQGPIAASTASGAFVGATAPAGEPRQRSGTRRARRAAAAGRAAGQKDRRETGARLLKASSHRPSPVANSSLAAFDSSRLRLKVQKGLLTRSPRGGPYSASPSKYSTAILSDQSLFIRVDCCVGGTVSKHGSTTALKHTMGHGRPGLSASYPRLSPVAEVDVVDRPVR